MQYKSSGNLSMALTTRVTLGLQTMTNPQLCRESVSISSGWLFCLGKNKKTWVGEAKQGTRNASVTWTLPIHFLWFPFSPFHCGGHLNMICFLLVSLEAKPSKGTLNKHRGMRQHGGTQNCGLPLCVPLKPAREGQQLTRKPCAQWTGRFSKRRK